MAKLANTFVSTDAVGNREELSNVVNRITPEDTPAYSLMDNGTAKSVNPEWETDTLEAPAENAQPEGNEYNFEAIQPVVRVGNYTQIYTKTFIMSKTQDAVSNAGRAEQYKEKKLKRGIEIKKDVELSILLNNASVGGETRETGGLPTWLETNANRGAGGANGGFDQGTKLTVAATAGTQRTFTKALMDEQMQASYISGASVKYIMTSPHVRSVFTTFMSDANVATFEYRATAGRRNTMVGTAAVYDGDFGKLMVVPNRVMVHNAATASNAFLLDPSMLSFKWLRKIREDKDLAKTGDSKKHAVVGEGTLCVKNEAGLSVVADLFGLTAST